VTERSAVKLSTEAAAALAQAPRQSRGRLVMTLCTLGARGLAPNGLFSIASSHHLAACEASSAARVVLVYAVVDRRQLHRELVGEPIARRAESARVRRMMRKPITRR
jgi:hypothetical protein